MPFLRLPLLALLLAGSFTRLAAQPGFTAALDRETIAEGESAVLTLTFENGSPAQVPVITPPPGLRIDFATRNTQMQIVNGRRTDSVSLLYSVVPSQAGEHVIPSITATVGNRRLSTPPLTLRVLTREQAGTSGQMGYAFLRLIVPKDTAYLGEVIPLEIQLFHAVSGDQLQTPQIQSEGFSFGPVVQSPQNPNTPPTQINNVTYRMVGFRTTAVPVKTGRLSLGPAQCSLILHIPVNNRSRNPFDDFFSFGPRAERRQVTLSSPSQFLTVRPLPEEGKPAGFTGAVGQYEWTVSASPTNVMAGDPVTLNIQIVGRGALESLALPTPDWREFKTYPPTAQIKTTDPLGIEGVKIFEQVVVPQNGDVRAIPAFSFVFFDPERKTYRTLQHAPIALSVRPGSSPTPQPVVLAGNPASPPAETAAPGLAHIKPFLGPVAALSPPLLARPWFLALQALPLAGLCAVWSWRHWREARERNPRRRRRRETARMIRSGLADLRTFAAHNNPAEFFATTFRLLQEQIGERLDLPSGSITEAAVDDYLPDCGAEPAFTERLHRLFQACNDARYGGRGGASLEEMLPQVEQALREIGSLRPRWQDKV